MSLNDLRSCATCHKTELEVKIKPCSKCNVINYCSKDCRKANRENHKGHCKDIVKGGEDAKEAILEIGLIHNNYQAMSQAAEQIDRSLDVAPDVYEDIFNASDLICFYIELGTMSYNFLLKKLN